MIDDDRDVLTAVDPVARPSLARMSSVGSAWSQSKVTPPGAIHASRHARFDERLETALARPIVWLQGPPGAGKTTLVARYLADRAIDPIWYRLDTDDADPATLFFYLSLAAARVEPTIGSVLPAVRPEYLREADRLSQRFFRALHRGSGPSILVFDDYQDVDETSAVHDCLAEGLKDIPDHSHVIFVSRAPPPKAFARLRMKGAIDVIPPHELRLTLEEALTVARSRSLVIAPPVIERLVDQTQGWTAGLILMMEAQASPSSTGGDLVSAPELLFDYFAGEVFQRLSERSKQILMMLSSMPSMPAEAAAFLAEDDDATVLIADLADRAYFTVRAGETDPHYRFHPLFRDFLQAQARASFDDAERHRLRLRAATALERVGQFEAAAALFGEAAAWQELKRIIEAWASTLVDKGRHATLLAWLERLPTAMVDQDGWLCFWMATARSAFAPAQSRRLFRRAHTLFEAGHDGPGMLLAWAGLTSAVIDDPSSNQAELDGDIALLRQMMPNAAVFPSDEVKFRVSLVMYLALNRRSADRVEMAVWRDRAMAAAVAIGKPGLVILVRNYVALYSLIDNDFATVREQFAAIPPPAALAQEPLLQAVAYLAQGLGQLFGQIPGRCEDTAEDALAASKASGIYLWTHFHAGFEAVTESDLPRGRKWLRRTAQLSGKVAVYHGAHYQMMANGVALLAGDSEEAVRSGKLAVEMTVADGWLLYEAMARVGLAQALESAGDPRAGQSELDAAEAASARVAIRSLKISTLFLRADFLLKRGETEAGLAALAEAMHWGETTGGRRTMLTAQRMSRLCARALVEAIRPDYARLLIQVSRLPPPDRSIEQWPWPLQITTLGGFRIAKGGEPLTLSRKTPKRLFTLLKAIIAFGATNVPETKLVDAVWPDEEGDAGHRALDAAIHRLRKLIGDAKVLIVQGGRVSLDPAHCWLDLWAFENVLAAAQDGPPNAAILALYKGPFLAGDDDLAWAEPRRRQLALRYVRAGR